MSISIIYQQLKSVSIQKSIQRLSEEHSNAKWLEVLRYFPEDFRDDNDQIFNLI